MDSSYSLKGLELGKLVLNSGLLQSSWSKISESYETPNQESGLGIKIYDEVKHTFMVFAEPSSSRNDSCSTLLSGSDNLNPFHFLCSEKISSFSVHTAAFQLFETACMPILPQLKLKLLEANKPVIITGAALGGSVASLFTLWLLESIDPKLKRPLCITFGSPLIGDASLQQILEDSTRNSCFLHVTDVSQNPITTDFFKPFGMFLICFKYEYLCIEDPEAIMELLIGHGQMQTNTNVVVWRNYGEVLQRLDRSLMADSRLMIEDIISRMEKREEKKKMCFDQLKKLNDMKILMAKMEWYKKKSKEEKIGYYDRFKTKIALPTSVVEINVEKWKMELNDYWKTMVEEVEKKPQSEKAVLKKRCLFAANNYRRMMEPLDIAEYYINGRKKYRSLGRSKHYVMLEIWWEAEAEAIKAERSEKRDLSDILMFDSCFWAEVEESLIAINLLKTELSEERREVLIGELKRFEEYALGMIGKREVSPEIFLEKSSFMEWWKQYKEIKGFNSPPSRFTEFMNTRMYNSYGQIIN